MRPTNLFFHVFVFHTVVFTTLYQACVSLFERRFPRKICWKNNLSISLLNIWIFDKEPVDTVIHLKRVSERHI